MHGINFLICLADLFVGRNVFYLPHALWIFGYAGLLLTGTRQLGTMHYALYMYMHTGVQCVHIDISIYFVYIYIKRDMQIDG